MTKERTDGRTGGRTTLTHEFRHVMWANFLKFARIPPRLRFATPGINQSIIVYFYNQLSIYSASANILKRIRALAHPQTKRSLGHNFKCFICF